MRTAVALAIVLLASTSAADRRSHDRTGFTFEFNLGVGFTHARPYDGRATSAFGVGGPSFSIGGWYPKQFAITGRFSLIQPDDDLETSNTFFGPALQFWPHDRIFLGVGAGWGGIRYAQPATDIKGYNGLALSLRVGFKLVGTWAHTLNVSVEALPGVYPDETNVPVALQLGYNFL